ncbi:MAG: glycosyltransferase family 4 protein [Deltaproteobacteria bacterium]|nr:glycosyltransferase family 4 protein [Deltaproteobacteria bacterium]
MADPLSRVLFCAFAEVPGPSATGARTAHWLSVLGHKEIDALCLKGKKDAHIQRYGGARMMRVPNTIDKAFLERLSTYQRALQRQLKGGDSYEMVWCADLFSASAAAPLLPKGTSLVVEIAEVPSLLSAARALVGDSAEEHSAKWLQQEKAAIRAAARVVVPSRHAAKLLSERVDARLLWMLPRCVDRAAFSPPSVEVSLDDDRRVLVFGGREGRRLRGAVSLAHALVSRLPESVQVGVLGAPGPYDGELRALLDKRGLGDRVALVDADAPPAVAGALSLAKVVVVPSSAEDEAEPFAMPHRALEAMACGRAVVVTGPDAAFREAGIPGEHFLVAPARDPLRAADVVVGLLGDDGRREALGRAAARHVEKSADLMMRAEEVRERLAATLKVRLKVHRPRIDNPDTSSRSVSEPQVASAPVPLGPALPAAQAPATAVVTASLSGETAPTPAAPADAAPRRAAPRPPAPLEPVETVRFELLPGHGLWEGDTFLDGGLPAALESADPARVRAAMMLSSDAGRSKSQPDGDDNIPSVSPSAVQSVEASGRIARPQAPRALSAEASRERGAADPWAPDTIADGTPLDLPRASAESAAPRTHVIKSLLVEAMPAPTSSAPSKLSQAPRRGTGSDLTVEEDRDLTSSEE